MHDDRPSRVYFFLWVMVCTYFQHSDANCYKLLQTLSAVYKTNMVIFVLFLVCLWFRPIIFQQAGALVGRTYFAHIAAQTGKENLFSDFPSSPLTWYEYRWALIHDTFLNLMPSECVLRRCDEPLLSFRACTVCVEATEFATLRSTLALPYRTATLVTV